MKLLKNIGFGLLCLILLPFSLVIETLWSMKSDSEKAALSWEWKE